MPLDVFDLRAFTHKIETTEGTDAVPTPAADAILLHTGSGQIQVDELERNIDNPQGGAKPYVPVRRRGMITGEIELAGAATAGDAAPIGRLLRSHGHTEVLEAGPPAQALYTPVLHGFPSASSYFYHAGELFKIVGGRGRLTSIDLAINDFPKAGIEIMGKVEAVEEAAVPTTIDTSAFQDPIVGTEDKMTILLDGEALEGVSLSLDPGISLNMVYHTEATVSRQSIRAVTGTLRVYRPLVATADIRSMARSAAKVPLIVDYLHETPARSLFLTAPRVQIGEPQIAELDGLVVWDIPVRLLPDDGNDDYTLGFGLRQ